MGGGKSQCGISIDRTPTLAATHGGEPVVAVEGNGTRPSHKGSGYSEDNISFTLNATEHHGVAYSVENHPADSRVRIRNDGTVQSLTERMGTGGGNVPMVANAVKQEYIVRRLTPTECARLQGFPDWWCADLDTPDPTEDDIAYWSEVFETYRKVVNPDGKPKTRKQIVKWLQHPHTDSAEYKMWGNGVALPNVYYVMCGIASIMNEEV